MRRASPRQPKTRSRRRLYAAGGALALAATLCTGALAAVSGDNGRLPSRSGLPGAPVAPDEHPGEAAKRAAVRERRGDQLTWPLHGAVTGRFGEGRGGHSHDGLDIPMPAGTPIRAASDGRVVMREHEAGYGRYTCIAHKRITTCYAHQSRFRTTKGAPVGRGQVIGYVGNTGNSGAIHLHFEVRRGTRPWGTPVNPRRFLPR